MLSDVRQRVLVPYKITLLSNKQIIGDKCLFVLVPYKITLLSNTDRAGTRNPSVLVPYKITLLSNNDDVLPLVLQF